LAYEQPLFASQRGITSAALIKVLTKLELFKNAAAFKKNYSYKHSSLGNKCAG
jgi:hypothetical protein